MLLWLSAIAAALLVAAIQILRERRQVKSRIAEAQRFLDDAAFEPAGFCVHCGRQVGTLVTKTRGRLSLVDVGSRSFLCPGRDPVGGVHYGHELGGSA